MHVLNRCNSSSQTCTGVQLILKWTLVQFSGFRGKLKWNVAIVNVISISCSSCVSNESSTCSHATFMKLFNLFDMFWVSVGTNTKLWFNASDLFVKVTNIKTPQTQEDEFIEIQSDTGTAFQRWTVRHVTMLQQVCISVLHWRYRQST